MDNCPTCSHMPWSYQSTKWFVISPLHVVRGTWDSVTTSNMSLEKKVDMKCIQVNVLSKGEKETVFLSCHICILQWICTPYLRECEGAPCSKQTRYLKLKWLQRDSNPQPLSQQFNQNGQMVKWLNFAKWLSVLYELQVFMDWNPVAMTTRGGDKRTD